MKITKKQFHERNLTESILPYLTKRIFHVTKKSNLNAILECGEIRSGKNNKFETTFGYSSNSFFRNRGCISLFDYKTATKEQFDKYFGRCHPAMPVTPEDEIAILLINDSIYHELLSWELWREEQAYSEMVLPYLEAGHQGPISIKKVDEILIVSIIEDPHSLAAKLRKVHKQRGEEC